MKTQNNELMEYLENVRYYSETSSVSELPHVLKNIYDQVKSHPEVVNESLVQALDLNVRQLLKNSLTERVAFSELSFFQRIITIAENVLLKANNKNLSDSYLSRWRFAIDVVKDRKHELSVDKESFVRRPQVKRFLRMLLTSKRVDREQIEHELGVTKQRATNLVREMKALSLVEDFVLPDDKRKREYALTAEGVKICKAIGIHKRADDENKEAFSSNKLSEEVHKAVSNEKPECSPADIETFVLDAVEVSAQPQKEEVVIEVVSSTPKKVTRKADNFSTPLGNPLPIAAFGRESDFD